MSRRPRRPIYIGVNMPRLAKKQRIILRLILIFLLIVAASMPFTLYLKKMSMQMALSDASDLITKVINETINEKMSDDNYDYNYFVTLQKDNDGNITAITTNMSRINTLSSEILSDVIDATESGAIILKIPVGNLSGSNLLIGRGPEIPIKIITLSSSFADFRNEFSSAGINQTRHQIILEISVEIDVFLPWEIKQTTILSQILIAETVIVGKIPETYLKVE